MRHPHLLSLQFLQTTVSHPQPVFPTLPTLVSAMHCHPINLPEARSNYYNPRPHHPQWLPTACSIHTLLRL